MRHISSTIYEYDHRQKEYDKGLDQNTNTSTSNLLRVNFISLIFNLLYVFVRKGLADV